MQGVLHQTAVLAAGSHITLGRVLMIVGGFAGALIITEIQARQRRRNQRAIEDLRRRRGAGL